MLYWLVVKYVIQMRTGERLQYTRWINDYSWKKNCVSEIFSLDTHLCNVTRPSFHIDYILSIKDRSIVDYTRETLERSIKELPSTSADGILSSLNQVFGKKVGLAGISRCNWRWKIKSRRLTNHRGSWRVAWRGGPSRKQKHSRVG